jgi:hypothetical protein
LGRFDQSKIAFAALAAPNSVDLKKFVKVLEQRKPKGVASRNRRHFFRGPWTHRVAPDANLP